MSDKAEWRDHCPKLNLSGRRRVLASRGSVLRFMAKVLKRTKPPPGDLLDIGVGDGYLLRLCNGAGYRCCGAELSGFLVRHLQESFARDNLKIDVRRCGADNLTFDDQAFDVVTCFDVLEHLSAEVFARTLKEVRRVLRSDGVLVGTFPEDEDLEASSVLCPKCGHIFHPVGHEQSFTGDKMREALMPYFSSTTFAPGPHPLPDRSRWVRATVKAGMKALGVAGSGYRWTYFVAAGAA